MGFLDDLKKQAQDLQSRGQVDLAGLARNTALTEAAASTAARYLAELTRQLAVIQPTSPARYEIDRKAVVHRVPLAEFRSDARKKRLRDEEVFEHVVFQCVARGGQNLVLAKDFINEIEKLEARLRQSGVPGRSEAVRNPDNGKLQEMRYEFVTDVVVSVNVDPRHDEGHLQFQMRNFDGLETVECAFPAIEVGQARMDELAKWLLGQPHRFLEGAVGLRRTEPR
jgi:hypothetical protein